MKIVRDTPFEVGYTVFPVRPPQDSLTVVVKATFDLPPAGGECTLAEKQSLVTGDEFDGDDPNNGLKYSTDLAVLKPRGDCYLVGSCHAPGGRATALTASFRVGTIGRSIAVFGDRHWRPRFLGGGLSAPEPFASMPLSYERCFGGPGFDANPVGRGIAAMESPQGARVMLPNLEDPQRLIGGPNDRPAPAAVSPVHPGWKSRTSRMGTYDARWRDTRWPWFPEDFDWAFFNAAPTELQAPAYFRGDEEISLQNLLRGRAKYSARLPGLRPRAFAEITSRDGAQLRELNLNLDTIVIDTDRARAMCVWRGLTDVRSERLDEVRHLFVVHERRAEHKLPSHYRLWFERKLAEDAAEDAPPPEALVPPEAPEALAPKPPPPRASGAAFAKLDALIATAGISAAKQASSRKPPRPPSAKNVAAQYRALGLVMPAGLGELFAAATANAAAGAAGPVRAPTPPDARSMRAKIEGLRADGRPLIGQDFSGADLSGMDLSRVDLSRAVLAGATLRGAKLDGATLRGTNLAGADLSLASLREALLNEADLTAVVGTRAVFAGAVLDGAVLTEADAGDADFSDASCEKTDFTRAKLQGAVFRDARAAEADFSHCVLDRADFARAALTNASLTGATGARLNMSECDVTGLRADEGVRFTGANFSRARGEGSIWTDAQLNECNFSFAELSGADFGGASLQGAALSGASIPGGKFRLARLANAQMVKSDFCEGTFEGADLSGADLRGSNLHAAQFWRARTQGAKLELAIVTGTLLAR